MTALTLHVVLAVESVRLITTVATTAQLVLAKECPTPRLVAFFMAVGTLQYRVFVFERPTAEFVIKAVLARRKTAPTHDVVAATLMLQVTIEAALSLDLTGRVKTVTRFDSRS